MGRRRQAHAAVATPRRIVVVGGGGAGFAAAEMLRREAYDGALTIVSADADPPYDPAQLLEEDYLAGKALEQSGCRSATRASTNEMRSTFEPGPRPARWTFRGAA